MALLLPYFDRPNRRIPLGENSVTSVHVMVDVLGEYVMYHSNGFWRVR